MNHQPVQSQKNSQSHSKCDNTKMRDWEIECINITFILLDGSWLKSAFFSSYKSKHSHSARRLPFFTKPVNTLLLLFQSTRKDTFGSVMNRNNILMWFVSWPHKMIVDFFVWSWNSCWTLSSAHLLPNLIPSTIQLSEDELKTNTFEISMKKVGYVTEWFHEKATVCTCSLII